MFSKKEPIKCYCKSESEAYHIVQKLVKNRFIVYCKECHELTLVKYSLFSKYPKRLVGLISMSDVVHSVNRQITVSAVLFYQGANVKTIRDHFERIENNDIIEELSRVGIKREMALSLINKKIVILDPQLGLRTESGDYGSSTIHASPCFTEEWFFNEYRKSRIEELNNDKTVEYIKKEGFRSDDQIFKTFWRL